VGHEGGEARDLETDDREPFRSGHPVTAGNETEEHQHQKQPESSGRGAMSARRAAGGGLRPAYREGLARRFGGLALGRLGNLGRLCGDVGDLDAYIARRSASPKQVIGITETGVRLHPKSVFGFARNQCSTWTDFRRRVSAFMLTSSVFFDGVRPSVLRPVPAWRGESRPICLRCAGRFSGGL